MKPPSSRLNLPGALAATWGLSGISALLLFALHRLYTQVETLHHHALQTPHYLLAIPWILYMLYMEGDKGFRRAFAPRVAARALCLAQKPTWPTALLAPIFCIGYFGASKKRKRASYLLTLMILTLILLVQQLPQPWRGLIDLGVLLGLTYGLLFLLYFTLRTFHKNTPLIDPQLPPTPQ